MTVVDVQTDRPAGQPTIADLYPTSFDIVAGNDQGLFEIVNTTPSDSDEDDRRRIPSADSDVAAGKRGNYMVGFCHAPASVIS